MTSEDTKWFCTISAHELSIGDKLAIIKNEVISKYMFQNIWIYT